MNSGKATAERGASTIWLQGLLCGALAALATPLALLLLVLLAPSVAAALLERQPGRPATRTLLLFGLSASISPARRLLAAGDTMAASLGLLSEPNVLAAAWSAAAGAWMLAELSPLGLALALDASARARAARLRARRERLLEDWPGLNPDSG
ncbi:MAG TPA: hypothetical protein VLI93_14995 [Acetobacteraceae bacterium]|nr:hypothetical protein [Acetobacteraceae bacterium]